MSLVEAREAVKLRLLKAARGEGAQVAAFYREQDYTQPLSSDDLYVVAEKDGALCGALRLCREQGVWVLRGLRIQSELRRQGIGTQMLRVAVLLVGGNVCYCIPHRYLAGFYGRVGFAELPEGEGLAFLRERLTRYRREFRLDVILMVRALAPGHLDRGANSGRAGTLRGERRD